MPMTSEIAKANGDKGGRPQSSPTRMTRKKAEELCDRHESPLDVMVENMLFWWRHAQGLGERLEELVAVISPETAPDERADILKLGKMFLAARENAQRCAVDAAPYVHPRLQSIDARLTVKPAAPPAEITDDTALREAAEAWAVTMRETAEAA